MIDTHCHPYMNSKKDEKAIINSFFSDGWKSMIVIWTDLETSKKAIKMANENKNIYASIWVHPCDIDEIDLIETLKILEKLYLENKEKIVAIWEIWLDYYRIWKDAEKLEKENKLKDKKTYIKKRKELQSIFFEAQIIFAQTYNIPFIIHNREAGNDVLKILKKIWYKNFIFHSFSENYDFAKKVLDFAPNSMFSFSGIITFKNALKTQESAKLIPEKNILAETDSPFLTPTPFRWKEENEPKFTKYVIEKISDLKWKNMSEIILENSKRFFKI